MSAPSYEDLAEAGVLVAGRYNSEGRPTEKSFVIGDNKQISELDEKFKRNMLGLGGEFVPSTIKGATSSIVIGPKKRGRKSKKINLPIVSTSNIPQVNPGKLIDLDNSIYQSNEDNEIKLSIVPNEEQIESFDEDEIQKRVTFKNNFGKMILEVEEVVIQDNFGIMLVFSNNNKLTFIPNTGDVLQFSENGTDFANVFFPGCLFNYHNKIMMILFNSSDNIKEIGE